MSVTHIPIRQRLTIEQFDKPVRYLTTIVEALINDQSFFIPLAVKLAHEFILTFHSGVRHIDISYFPSGCLVYFQSVAFDPGEVA